jgi:hypothetical protein
MEEVEETTGSGASLIQVRELGFTLLAELEACGTEWFVVYAFCCCSAIRTKPERLAGG